MSFSLREGGVVLQAADKRTARQPRPRPKPQTVSEAFERLDNALQAGSAAELIPIPTGFEPLDRVLGGGLRPGELTLVGGIPGVGKTIATLQWARNIASQGRTTIFACYEHEEVDLLVRLLALEMGEISDTGNPEV
ncbi:MAG: DnaB-like helicase C-terminal domain-containing protein, partial [Actinomycetota bacterium]